MSPATDTQAGAEADRCALLSRALDEDLAGTASRVTRWLAIERPGSWGENALLDSKLDERAARTLQSAARRHRVRVLLIRRPGWRKPDGARRVYLARTRPTGSWIERIEAEDDHQLTDLDWDVFDADESPGLGEPGPDLHLVCTNGKHDPCCADQARPVVRALDESDVPEVWESSHVGGDRFAANVVCLPVGVYFGRVGADEAASVLHDMDDGVIRLDRYRGRSCYGTLVQAAEVFVRRAVDEPRVDALSVAGVERLDDDHRRVTFQRSDPDDGGARSVSITVGREQSPPRLLACDHAPSPPWRYFPVGEVEPGT